MNQASFIRITYHETDEPGVIHSITYREVNEPGIIHLITYHEANEPGVMIEKRPQMSVGSGSNFDVAEHEGGDEDNASHTNQRQSPTRGTGSRVLFP